MITEEKEQLAADGIAALMEKLGPVRAIEFIRLCDQGIADYTAERHRWLDGISLEQIAETAKARDALPG